MSDMSDSRLMIVPCYQHIPCNSMTCYNVTGKRYYVANPYSGGIFNYPVFCEECIQYLVAHMPAELSPEAAEVESRLRKELTEEYNGILAQKIAEMEKVAVAAAMKLAAQKIAEAQSPFGVAPVEDLVPIEEQDKTIYRCLDCGMDFDNKEALDAHKPSHTVKNKGGRPPKSKA